MATNASPPDRATLRQRVALIARMPGTWPADVRWAVGLMFLVAVLGGMATQIGPWYLALVQPAWKPPDWLFGPVWTTLYITTAWAGVRTWRRLPSGSARSGFLVACLINAVLNVLWSILYFSLRRPDWALFEGIALWCSAAWVSSLMWRIDRFSAGLMVPHLVWLAVAWALNLSTVRLNPAFHG